MRTMVRAIALSGLVASAVGQGQAPVAEEQTRGSYRVVLRLPPDGLFSREEMQIEFSVTDAITGKPVTGARVKATINMPAMPGMPPFEEVAHSEGVPGEYGVHPSFPHGGDYRMRLTVLQAARTVDQPGEFTLHVGDISLRSEFMRVQPFSLQMKANPAAPRAGESTFLRLAIRRETVERQLPDGTSVKDYVRSFDRSHEKLMHLLIVRSDLGLFAHEHPELTGAEGIFCIRYSFPTAGSYRVFADVAPHGAGSQVVSADIRVTEASATPQKIAPFELQRADRNLRRTAGDLSIEWDAKPPLTSGKTLTISAFIRDADGRRPVLLQPYLGARGHLMLFSQDGKFMVHCHPDEQNASFAQTGQIPFLVRFPKPGLYREWLQFQQAGRVVTSDVVLEAVDAAL